MVYISGSQLDGWDPRRSLSYILIVATLHKAQADGMLVNKYSKIYIYVCTNPAFKSFDISQDK